MADLLGIDRRDNKKNKDFQNLKKGVIPKGSFKFRQCIGLNSDKGSMYDVKRWKFLLDAPFEISEQCCYVMKKSPTHDYSRKTGRVPMLAQMASESMLRTQKWLKSGCNGFDSNNPQSNPMAFWLEQDVLQYILQNNIKIASVYGEIVTDEGAEFVRDEDFRKIFGFDLAEQKLKTTGCQRTGCMFCGYGCHLEKSPNRFEMMKETHPKQYAWIMKPWSEGGLGYKDVIDWINEHGKTNIKY